MVNKKVSTDIFDRLFIKMRAFRPSVLSEIGCILLYAVVPHVVALAYFALVSKKMGLKLFHSSTSARARSPNVTTSYRLFTLLPILSQQCSMRFISGILLGHWSFSIPSWARVSITIRALYGWALSSWKMAWCARKCGYTKGWRISSM